MRKPINYPMGSISSGTMRAEDLIPTLASELEYRAKHDKHVAFKTRKTHMQLAQLIDKCIAGDCDHEHMEDCPDSADNYYQSEAADNDLESLFDALDAYSAPYFYFGSHPGNGADYGYWLSESWDEDFLGNPGLAFALRESAQYRALHGAGDIDPMPPAIKVSDLSEVPSWFRGEVAVVNDHGNVTLYVKTSRALREIWSVV